MNRDISIDNVDFDYNAEYRLGPVKPYPAILYEIGGYDEDSRVSIPSFLGALEPFFPDLLFHYRRYIVDR